MDNCSQSSPHVFSQYSNHNQPKFTIKLGSVLLCDTYTRNSYFPKLIEPQCETERRNLLSAEPQLAKTIESTNTRPLFSFQLDTNPPPKEGNQIDLALDISLEKLNIVYNYSFIKRTGSMLLFILYLAATNNAIHLLVDFFYNPFKADAIAENKLTSKLSLEKGRNQLMYLIERKKRFMVKLNAEAPNVIIPKDCTDSSSPMLVLGLGHASLETQLGLKVTSEVTSPLLTSQAIIDDNIRRDFYDTFMLQLRSIQAVMTHVSRFDNLFEMVC